MNMTRPVSLPVFFQACGTLRGKNAQVPGPPTVTSSPIRKVISPASTQATSSLSRIGNLVADPKGDLAGEHPGDLVAVTVEMEETLGTGGDGLLEQHDALIGLVAEELQGGEATGCRHIEIPPAAGGHDKALCCVHAGVLPCGGTQVAAQCRA